MTAATTAEPVAFVMGEAASVTKVAAAVASVITRVPAVMMQPRRVSRDPELDRPHWRACVGGTEEHRLGRPERSI